MAEVDTKLFKLAATSSSGLSDEARFVQSANIKVFPCGWRGKTTSDNIEGAVAIDFNREARLHTEYNYVHIPGTPGRNTYLLSNSWSPLCFSIGGYYFEITGLTPEDFEVKNSNNLPTGEYRKFAIIRVEEAELSRTNDGTRDYQETTKVLNTWLSDTVALDYCNSEILEDAGKIDKYIFTGLAFDRVLPTDRKNIKFIQLLDDNGNLNPEYLLPEVRAGSGENAVVINGTRVLDTESEKDNTEASKATGKNSTAFGTGNTAKNDNQVVVGTYNDTIDTDDIFTVGAGSETTPRDALIVRKSDIIAQGLSFKDVFVSISEDATELTKSKYSNTENGVYASRVKRSTKARHLVDDEDKEIAKGDGLTLIYFSKGRPIVSTAGEGSTTRPVYITGGKIAPVDQITYGTKKLNPITAIDTILNKAVTFTGVKTWADAQTFKSDLTLEKALAIGGALTAKNTATFESTATFKSTTSFEKAVALTDTLTVNQSATFKNSASIANGLTLNNTVASTNKVYFSSTSNYIGLTSDNALEIYGSGSTKISGGKLTIATDLDYETGKTACFYGDAIFQGTAIFGTASKASVVFKKGASSQETINMTGSTTAQRRISFGRCSIGVKSGDTLYSALNLDSTTGTSITGGKFTVETDFVHNSNKTATFNSAVTISNSGSLIVKNMATFDGSVKLNGTTTVSGTLYVPDIEISYY